MQRRLAGWARPGALALALPAARAAAGCYTTAAACTRTRMRTVSTDTGLKHPCFQIQWERADGVKVPGLAFGDQQLQEDPDAPSIIMLQEWWGVDEQVKLHAARLSEEGYRVIIPDLYRGKLGVEAEEAEHLMTGLDWQGAVEVGAGIVPNRARVCVCVRACAS